MELMIAERLKKYRKERNMTQEALAEVFGISPQSVSKWECGDGYPDITFLPTIANYFEVTVDELIAGTDRETIRSSELQQKVMNWLFENVDIEEAQETEAEDLFGLETEAETAVETEAETAAETEAETAAETEAETAKETEKKSEKK